MLSYFNTGSPLLSGVTFPTALDEAIRNYYEIVDKWYKARFNKNVTAECFGKAEDLDYDTINDFNYLLLLYIIHYLERMDAEHFEECPVLADPYLLDPCVQEYFKCKGFDLSETNAIFKLITGNMEGIDFMAIEEAEDSDCDDQIFTVT